MKQASSWVASSLGPNLKVVGLSSPPTRDSMAAFDGGKSSVADMSFTQLAISTDGPCVKTTEALHHPGRSENEKAMKPYGQQSPMQGSGYWMSSEVSENVGSLDVNYPYKASQNGLETSSADTPRLGSGIHSNVKPTILQDDTIDDATFEQALSEEENMFMNMSMGGGPYQDGNGMPSTEVPPNTAYYPDPVDWNRRSSIMDSTPDEMSRQAYAGALGSSMQSDEDSTSRAQTFIYQETSNADRPPASFLPPTGFGLGFGAGLGRPSSSRWHRGMDQKTNHPASESCLTRDATGDSKRAKAFKAGSALPSRPVTYRRTKSHESGAGAKDKPRSVDRIAHNDVERKYRTNLKDKIAELRDAVPALHPPQDATGAEQSRSQTAPKVSKGTVLTKATEYIHQLEQRNRAIMIEHQQLARRLQAFEALLNNSSRQQDAVPSHSMALFDPRGFC